MLAFITKKKTTILQKKKKKFELVLVCCLSCASLLISLSTSFLFICFPGFVLVRFHDCCTVIAVLTYFGRWFSCAPPPWILLFWVGFLFLVSLCVCVCVCVISVCLCLSIISVYVCVCVCVCVSWPIFLTGNSVAVYCLGFPRHERKINESGRTPSVFTLH